MELAEYSTLETCVARNAAGPSAMTAVRDADGEAMSYARLLALAEERCAKLGDVKGRQMPFRVTHNADFLVEYLAIHMAGGIAVPLDRHLPDELFDRHLASATSVSLPEDTADVLYTTGTTGRQKGVVISHRSIMSNVQNLIEAQGYAPGMTFIINGPLNHIGSLSKVWATLGAGGTLCFVDGMKNMDAFFRAIDKSPCKVATFLVPASIRMLLTFAGKRLADYADKIDFIETGAAPIAPADMQRLCQLLPHTRLYNTYASTETGIIATCNYNDGECLPGCLGQPMLNSGIVITPDGHIACKGSTLMTGYVGDEALTASVLHDGMLFTSDLGRLDEQGRLRLEGRDSDVINVGGYKVVPTDVEAAAMSLDAVDDCICLPATHPVLGTVLRLLVVMKEGEEFNKRELARQLSLRLEPFQVPMQYEQVAHIRRTFNGKLDRKSYL